MFHQKKEPQKTKKVQKKFYIGINFQAKTRNESEAQDLLLNALRVIEQAGKRASDHNIMCHNDGSRLSVSFNEIFFQDKQEALEWAKEKEKFVIEKSNGQLIADPSLGITIRLTR